MRAIQERKRDMYLAVSKIMQETDPSIIAAMPKMAESIDKLNLKIAAIDEARGRQESDRSGFAVKKQKLDDALVEKTICIVRKLRAYAVNEEDDVLASEVDYSESELARSADTVLADRCQLVHDRAVKMLAQLGNYMVTQVVLDDLQEAIDLFRDAIPDTRDAIKESSTATKDLAELFGETDKILDKMDILADMIRDSHGDFHGKFRIMRAITDPGFKKHRAIVGMVKDLNGEAIGNVSVKFDGSHTTTNAAGRFEGIDLVPGDYGVVFHKFGYKELVLTASVNDNETTEMDVVLEPKK